MNFSIVDVLRRACDAEAERMRLRDLLSRIIGDEGPDIDAYLDGHVEVPSIPSLIRRIIHLENELSRYNSHSNLRIDPKFHFYDLNRKDSDPDGEGDIP